MNYSQITSAHNTRMKLIQHLREKKGRVREQLFVVDALRDLMRALQHGYQVEFAMVSPELAKSDIYTVLQQIDAKLIFEVPADLLRKAGYRENPEGVVAVFHAREKLTAAHLPIGPQRILILDGLEKPGNVGALLRSADASGFEAVILSNSALDLFNPNIIRASTGAVFLHNIFEISREDTISYCTGQRIRVLGADPNAPVNLYDLDLTASAVAVVLGKEDIGLDSAWHEQADYLVRIPMLGEMVDSLNVSVSGALLMYEVLRQQRFL